MHPASKAAECGSHVVLDMGKDVVVICIPKVVDQAENRMLAAQAVLLHCCGLRGLWHPLRRDASSVSNNGSGFAKCGGKVTFA